jgi:DNA-binding MarR family transcriptional regulator
LEVVISREPETGPPSPDQPSFRPQPNTIEETGVDFSQLIDLCVKTISYGGRLSGGDLANRLALAYPVVEPMLAFLKREKLVEVVGSQGITERQYEYVLSDKGHEKASDAFERNQYVGPTPVPLPEYIRVVEEQSVQRVSISPKQVLSALSDLELSLAIRRLIGAAVNGGHSILLYGKPGNGKSSVAKRIVKMLGGSIIIPYAIDVGGQTIRVYDPRVHTLYSEPPSVDGERRQAEVPSISRERRQDRRWVVANRPLITVGGELGIEDLDLKYSPLTKFYLAPIQILANGGILLIDDFGRQKMRPKDLLNRWIVPMEDGIDHYSLLSGETIEIPFACLIVFSTNLQPERLGDEAFWRRIRHKIEITDPDESTFLHILRSECERKSICYRDEGARYLIETYYQETGRPFRAVHPRDLIGLLTDIGGFEGVQPELTPPWIDAACSSYFMEDSLKQAS